MKEFVEKLIGRLEENSFDMSLENPDCKAVWTDKAIQIVNQLAEEYNNGWIPVSERLPEESELVLIYAESRARGGSIRVVGHLHNGFWFAQTSSDTLGLTGIGQFDVIAWMPLPAPFKKGE